MGAVKQMRRMILFHSVFFIFLLGFGFHLETAQAGGTRLDLAELETGREIFSAVLQDGEQVVLTWRNSLFDLAVTEIFEAQNGALILTQATYADPQGSAPPTVPPQDAPEHYQTGGPFSAKGLAKPFKKLVFRVGEIGEPRMKIGDRIVEFKKEVGFGGGIVLTVRDANSL
jgi:hypothetical protein